MRRRMPTSGAFKLAAFGEQGAPPHVERHAMRRHVARVMHQRSAGQQDADPQPVGGRDKPGHGSLGAGRVEQPGDIGARRNDPARAPSDRPAPLTPRKPLLIAKRDSMLLSRSGS